MNPELRLLLGGDTMLGRGVNEVIKRAGPAYPLASLTRAADLFWVNLECAISPRNIVYSGPAKRFYFRADPVAAETLTHAGVGLVTLANNHALDADYDGLRDTLSILAEKGIDSVGAGENIIAASRPVFIEAQEQRLGVLAYCDHQSDFAATLERPGIRYVDVEDAGLPDLLAAEVEALALQVDHVVVAFHWQPNWVRHVPQYYRSLAKRLIEAGATIIWGHSPHHFQGVEWLDNSVVLYATGDLVDDYALHPHFRNDRQLLFQVVLSHEGVERVLVYPLELEFAHTQPALAEVRQWIIRRFTEMCDEVGSRVEPQDEWLEVLPAQSDGR
ncbi:MAG TPA: CapA family protein [Anaerolineae bacterium]